MTNKTNRPEVGVIVGYTADGSLVRADPVGKPTVWEAERLREMSAKYAGISRGPGLMPVTITQTEDDAR